MVLSPLLTCCNILKLHKVNGVLNKIFCVKMKKKMLIAIFRYSVLYLFMTVKLYQVLVLSLIR